MNKISQKTVGFLTMFISVGLSFFACDSRNAFPEDTIADAPIVKISVEEDSLHLHDTLRITVEASSEIGLSAIWWFAERQDLGELSQGRVHYCDGSKYEIATWEVVMDSVINFRIGANARDMEYGNGLPHQASDGHGIPYVWVYVLPE